MAEQLDVSAIKEDKQEAPPDSAEELLPEFNDVAEKVLQEAELSAFKEETQA